MQLTSSFFTLRPLALAAALAAAAPAFAQADASTDGGTAASPDSTATLSELRVLGTAEQALRQAPGVSVITAEDIAKRPPANDISELVRTMPGVNLSGNSSSGAYGNNRQIDLRGMGPENTLILIDGKPVSSRDSIRMGRSGERNTRGDSNWVPADAIERIEVLRGPAAARYGSGAAGGVVNIITKKPGEALTGSVTAYALQPHHSEEQDSRRLGFNLSGPISEKWSFRTYGNIARTSADQPALNARASGIEASDTVIPPAGREGVRNRDINGLLRWDLLPGHVLEFEGGFSRQGNIYAGDRLFTSSNTAMAELANAGAETNALYRRTGSITHRGSYEGGRTSRITAAYEGTTNSRLNEGLSGGGEGSISATAQRSKSDLDSYYVNGEFNTPLRLAGLDQILTLGAEYRKQRLDDPYSAQNAAATIPEYSARSEADTSAIFLEDNMEITRSLVLTPGVRLDHHDKFGNNWSPSLNASYEVTPEFTVKGGIARSFKAPNLYQSNPYYVYKTNGGGCPYENGTRIGGPCWIFGNADLEPEISVNKELGVAYNSRGWHAGLTYFQNDYKNKIIADLGDQSIPDFVTIGGSTYRAFQWVNSGKAIVKGFEGNLDIPIWGPEGRTLSLKNNLTYMIANKSKETDQPLSVIPRYTLNSTLDWQVDEKLSAAFTSTLYGKQKPRSRNMSNNTEVTDAGLNVRGSYAIFGASIGYRHSKALSVRAGVNNLLDKRLFREDSQTAAGAATYNEPGRAYYVSLTSAF